MQQICMFVLLTDRATPISSQQIFPGGMPKQTLPTQQKSPCSMKETCIICWLLYTFSSQILSLICSVYLFCILTLCSLPEYPVVSERLIVKQGPRRSSGTPYHQVFMVKRLNKNAPRCLEETWLRRWKTWCHQKHSWITSFPNTFLKFNMDIQNNHVWKELPFQIIIFSIHKKISWVSLLKLCPRCSFSPLLIWFGLVLHLSFYRRRDGSWRKIQYHFRCERWSHFILSFFGSQGGAGVILSTVWLRISRNIHTSISFDMLVNSGKDSKSKETSIVITQTQNVASKCTMNHK